MSSYYLLCSYYEMKIAVFLKKNLYLTPYFFCYYDDNSNSCCWCGEFLGIIGKRRKRDKSTRHIYKKINYIYDGAPIVVAFTRATTLYDVNNVQHYV